MEKIIFGVENPQTKKVVAVATTIFGGILWLNDMARIFSNNIPVIIIEGKSDVKNFGDLRKLENDTKIIIP